MKTNQELLAQLTKANKVYKLKLANKAGFSSVEEYKNSLKGVQETKKITKKVIVEVFENLIGTKAKISFQKKLKLDDVYDSVLKVYFDNTPKTFPTVLKPILKEAIEGEERIMNYSFHGKFDNNGLAYVTDLNKSESDNLRVINVDRINWIEVKGTKYFI